MGKRLRITKADIPNDQKGFLIMNISSLSQRYFDVAEKLQDTRARTPEYNRLAEDEKLYKYKLRQNLEKLALEDLSVAKNITNLLKEYDKDKNVYSFKRVRNYIRQQQQTEEIKKLTLMAQKAVSQEERAELKKYLAGKPRSVINALVKTAVDNYQKNRSDNNLLKVNRFLSLFNKKIVQKPYTKASPHEIRATRVDFSGYFNIPGRDDLAKYNPYSEFYQDFCRPKKQQNKSYDPFTYELEKCPAWQAMKETDALSRLEVAVREQLGKQGIPPEKIIRMNVNDFGRVLFNGYGRGYDPVRGSKLRLQDIDPELGSSHKKFFWQHNFLKDKKTEDEIAQLLLHKGVTASYIDVLFKSIKKDGNPNPRVNKEEFGGVIPYFTLHHTRAIQFLGKDANKQRQFVAIAEFDRDPEGLSETPEHDVWHVADAVVRRVEGINGRDASYNEVKSGDEEPSDYIEYLEDTRFSEQNDGRSWILSCGYADEDNICGRVDEMVRERRSRRTSYSRQEAGRWAMI